MYRWASGDQKRLRFAEAHAARHLNSALGSLVFAHVCSTQENNDIILHQSHSSLPLSVSAKFRSCSFYGNWAFTIWQAQGHGNTGQPKCSQPTHCVILQGFPKSILAPPSLIKVSFTGTPRHRTANAPKRPVLLSVPR